MSQVYNFIDIAKNNIDNHLIMDYGTGNLKTLLTDETTLSFTNRFEATLEGTLQGLASKLGGDASKVIAAGQQFFGGVQKNLKSIQETVLYWQGSEPLSFDFNTILIANKSTDNLIQQIQPLINMTNPDFDASNKLNFQVAAPLGYSPSMDNNEGKVGLSIGRWFQSPRVFVLTSAAPTISKPKTQNGNPIWINIRLAFTAYRMLSKNEIQSFLRY